MKTNLNGSNAFPIIGGRSAKLPWSCCGLVFFLSWFLRSVRLCATLGLAGVLTSLVAIEARGGALISNVNTDKAMYSPGAGATIYVDFLNNTGSGFSGTVEMAVSYLGSVVTNLPPQSVTVAAGATDFRAFSWTPPSVDYRGYQLVISVKNGGGATVDASSSAIDVSSDWRRFPRYGYISQFGAGLDAGSVIWQLKNYHINGLQFYDWGWKHHWPLAGTVQNPADSWNDPGGRLISRQTVMNLINAGHGYGIKSMSYNMMYVALAGYGQDGSGVNYQWGLFDDSAGCGSAQWNWGGYYFMFNPANSEWQNYIFGRESDAFAVYPFDGWHVDQFGNPGGLKYECSGNSVYPAGTFAGFLNNAKTSLGKNIVFNTVDGYGVDQVAESATVDFIYTECWGGNSDYNSFKTHVDNVRRYGSKATVFAAYMNYNKTSGYFNDAGVRLADAAIFASGGTHIELGDGSEMLRTEYFPENTVKISTSLRGAMRTYYDFLVGYQNLLRGDTVSASHQATITGVATSTGGSAGAVWVIAKKSPGFNLIHLINFLGNTSTEWRDVNGTYPTPPTQTNLAVKMYYNGVISGGKLWWASPDVNSGAASQLSYTTGSDGGGNYVNFTVPQLQYWDMVWLEINGITGVGAQIEAENYDSMAGVGTETTADVGGGLDVANVKNMTGDSWLAFNNVDFGAGIPSVSARVASALTGSRIEFRLDSPSGPLIATVTVGNTGGWQSWQTISAPVTGASGVRKLFVVFKDAASNLNWFKFALPSPWNDQDIGSVGPAGSASFSTGAFTLAGSGADIWGTGDAFHYAYQPISGDGSIAARITTQQNTEPWAKAGLMFRSDLTAGAVFADVVVTPGNGVAFQWRAAAGGECAAAQVAGIAVPTWLKLVRSGNDFSAYFSNDGAAWTQIGTSVTIAVSASAQIGLAVTAHNNSTTGTATFENIAINHWPVLSSIGNKAVNEGSLLTFTAGATDADAGQTLTFSLDAGAPAGAAINSASGAFTWTPTEVQGPSTYTVTVRATDNFGGSDSETIQINVAEVNAAPVLATIGNRSVNEGSLLTFTTSATDSDIPVQSLTFSLDAGAPAGAAIGAGSGVFTWTPTEAQGPSTNSVTVRVTDSSGASDTETIQITVVEVNTAPVLANIGNQVATVGTQLSFTASATDADLPAQGLTYSLDAGAPSGASINSSSGVFTWTPATVGVYNLTVRVTDSYGSSDSKLVQIIVSGNGVGLSGEYFDNMDFTGARVTRTNATVNFTWGTGMPDPVIGADAFSVRWIGQVQPHYSETYTFYTTTDDGVRLWVNGQLIIDKWIDQAATEWSGTITLVAGQKYDLRMEFYDNTGDATAKLSWSSSSQAKQVIPQSQLYLSPGLPSPWQTADIGAVAAAGSAIYSGGTFIETGSGADIEGTADEFRHVYQTSSGDCEMRARVANVQNTHPWAKAGVMIRENTTAGARCAGVFITPTNGVTFQWRTSTGGGTTASVVAGVTAPRWVRILRTSNSFSGYYSTNGTSWTQIGTSQTVSMATSATIGLAVTSHNDGTLCTATLDNAVATP